MRKRTRSPLGLSMNPKRAEGVGVVVDLDVENVDPDQGPDEGGSGSREVVNIRNEGGGSVGRAFFGKVVETMTGSSKSRRCEAIEGQGLLVVVLGLVAVDVIKERWEFRTREQGGLNR